MLSRLLRLLDFRRHHSLDYPTNESADGDWPALARNRLTEEIREALHPDAAWLAMMERGVDRDIPGPARGEGGAGVSRRACWPFGSCHKDAG